MIISGYLLSTFMPDKVGSGCARPRFLALKRNLFLAAIQVYQRQLEYIDYYVISP